jgi:hypothetical protein
MSSPEFKEKGQTRPPIHFKEGLNVVLGKEDGENSIGKSSAMLAIDFVFGGNTYQSSDGVKHIGHHSIFFAFSFNGKPRYFARSTSEAEKVFECTEKYELTGTVLTIQQYTDWLKASYQIDFPGLSFRKTLGSFFRIYGKDNTDERRPLRGIPGQNMQDSIEVLVKLFDRYKDIEAYQQALDEHKKKLDAFREARRYRFVPDLVGGTAQYEENVAQIKNLEQRLETLITEQAEGHPGADIEKCRLKAQLDGNKLRLETEIQSQQRRLKLLE